VVCGGLVAPAVSVDVVADSLCVAVSDDSVGSVVRSVVVNAFVVVDSVVEVVVAVVVTLADSFGGIVCDSSSSLQATR
jgi:hypothetical protein